MKAPHEVIKQARDSATSLKKSNEVIMSIAAIVESIQGADISKMEVSELESLAFEISGYMFTLSGQLNKANLEYNARYTYRKIRGAELYFEVEAKTSAARERLAEKQNQDNYLDELISNYYADVIKHLHRDCERIVSLLQSVMSNRRAEASKTSVQT